MLGINGTKFLTHSQSKVCPPDAYLSSFGLKRRANRSNSSLLFSWRIQRTFQQCHCWWVYQQIYCVCGSEYFKCNSIIFEIIGGFWPSGAMIIRFDQNWEHSVALVLLFSSFLQGLSLYIVFNSLLYSERIAMSGALLSLDNFFSTNRLSSSSLSLIHISEPTRPY